MRRVREAKDRARILRKTACKVKSDVLNRIVNKGVNLKSLLATCLLTDGSLQRTGNSSYRIAFYTSDSVLRDFVYSLLFRLSRYTPTIYRDKGGAYSVRVCDFHLAKELLELSPSFKKSPNRCQPVHSYLMEKQPTITFLDSYDLQTKKICARFAFSADGSISLDKRGVSELTLRCSHPRLSLEWQKILMGFGMIGRIRKDKFSWSGVGGVRFYNKQSLKKFLKMGGFIPGVKITRKSRFYAGIEKNTILKICLVGPVAQHG